MLEYIFRLTLADGREEELVYLVRVPPPRCPRLPALDIVGSVRAYERALRLERTRSPSAPRVTHRRRRGLRAIATVVIDAQLLANFPSDSSFFSFLSRGLWKNLLTFQRTD